ncbi:AAA domain-containing protein [Solitalea sp. MAHUQ-68]|uniref:AAA domain-containing protein n=1 Tax=Solitalea agri TaxID=2953739 RepID=A0A9X2JEM3_9SPHI|nr:AAA domain-containing protein [Solitalea agri]MCO4292541.1 AAA domain-containing protein [Solitalea agri]
MKGIDIPLDDLEEHSFQPISSVETDPSQQSILHSLEKTRNVLIQGPPGTGKSQTLTAVLINALENNKKTIVVCEKRTALEVLHNTLIEKGLNYNCVLIRDIVKDRKTVVDSVRDRVDNFEYQSYTYKSSKDHLDNIVNKAKNLITNINGKHQKLDQKIIGNKSWTDVVGDLLAELRNNDDDSRLNIEKSGFTYLPEELNKLLDLVHKGQSLYTNFSQIESKSFINSKKLVGDNPYKIEQTINDDFDYYSKYLQDIKNLLETNSSEFAILRKNELNQQIEETKQITTKVETIFDKNKSNADLTDENKLNGYGYKFLSVFSKAKKQTISDYLELQTIFQKLEECLKLTKDLKPILFAGTLDDKLKSLITLKNNIVDVQNEFETKIQNEFHKINLLKTNKTEINIKSLPILQEKVSGLSSKFNSDNWVKNELKTNDFYSFISELESHLKAKNEYFNSEQDDFLAEFKWFQFYNGLTENEKTIVDELKSKKNWRKPFLIFYLDSLLRFSASGGDLPVNDDEHRELDTTLNGFEKEQLKFIKKFWYSRQINTTQSFVQNNSGLSVENLYNKRSSHRFKRLSLRQIVQKDADLFSTFFPIILTSPDVASNLFKGMNRYFDIVMFDEASQLRLEDNLPAILKGKQIIIAGDEHQMPPSNYFSKVFDGAVEDEEDIDEEENVIRVDKDDILLSCESLLDFGTELNFQKKHLDFHYRSRHPHLIDFSNYAFYNQRLKPLPNNFDYIPIKYVQVNGTFSDHSNEAEAEMVLSIIDKNINRLPNGEYPTLGIATFNIAQRNLIKSKILERQKFSKYSEFNAKIQELEENGMFVKNLENIQGDERDVIILSTTYGIGKDRKFAQRFGPINHSKGYKLLNVIITRAKYKVYCCSSIPEQVFMNYKEYLTIEGSNNKRAVMYAYLAYCKAVSEADNDSRLSVLTALAENTSNSAGINSRDFNELESPFEEEVYQSLADHFGTEKLIPQLQFAGFRIDIVYDPKIKSVPKIAIECDGAKYHSSREAYLYDRHRQKILENHGFVFHRIWSTNWWRNSNRETKRLVDFIKQTEATVNGKIKDYSKTAYAFTDDIEILEEYVTQNSFIDIEKDGETIQAIEQVTPVQTPIFANDVVKLNSKVQIKYMNIGKDINVQLVSTENNKLTSNGIQKIYHKSPLGVSLLGHAIGDIVKIGNLDNFVEIIKIET